MFELRPIGVVHSPFKHRGDVPVKGYVEAGGRIEIFKEYGEGLGHRGLLAYCRTLNFKSLL